VTNLLHIVYN